MLQTNCATITFHIFFCFLLAIGENDFFFCYCILIPEGVAWSTLKVPTRLFPEDLMNKPGRLPVTSAPPTSWLFLANVPLCQSWF